MPVFLTISDNRRYVVLLPSTKDERKGQEADVATTLGQRKAGGLPSPTPRRVSAAERSEEAKEEMETLGKTGRKVPRPS